MGATDEQILRYEAALNILAQAQGADFSAAALPTLIARDKVAAALRDDSEAPTPAALEVLIKTDQRLTDLAPKFGTVVGSETLEDWRKAINPDHDAGWWKLDEIARAKQGWFKRLSTAMAVLLVTASVAVFADTLNTLRSMGANPVSTFGVLIQGTLAFIAASAFTEAGRKWLIDKFSRFGTRTFKGWARTALALSVFGITLAVWFIVPTGAAWYFNWKGNKYYQEQLYEQAADSYQQASALKPSMTSYLLSRHGALAKAAEGSTDYAKAVAEYKSMLALYRTGSIPVDDSYFFTQCRLLRLVILHDKNYALAENTIQELQKKIAKVSPPNRRLVQYFLLSYQGWIELERKNLITARSELEFVVNSVRDGPTAHYLLALVLEELKEDEEAKKHHQKFLQLLQNPQPDDIPLEWISYAQERTVNS